MTDLPTWAKDRAREWLSPRIGPSIKLGLDEHHIASLAALLVEVGNQRAAETLVRCCICDDVMAPRPDCECVICHRKRTLAEVRRVVEEIAAGEYCDQGAMARLILSRLEKL